MQNNSVFQFFTINADVPLFGPIGFLCHIRDLQPDCNITKYVGNSVHLMVMILHVSGKKIITCTSMWTKLRNFFYHSSRNIIMVGVAIARVTHTKLIGLYMQDD